MNRQIQLEIFKAQVANLRTLDQAWAHAKRGIHRDLLINNSTSVVLQTKLLALIYCAWSEAAFSKLVHTPHGFELDEIRQIKAAAEKHSIVAAWEKCIALALKKVQSRNGNYIPNIKLELARLLKTYIAEPSKLRNKVAHGQWVTALNSKSTAVNADLTTALEQLDIVKLEILRDGCKGLCSIVEALIESPDKAFHRDYWTLLCDIKSRLAEASTFTLEQKVALLKKKRSHAGEVTLRSTG